MKRTYFLIIICLGFLFYSNISGAAIKEWTILIYLGGDNALEPNAINDFNAFEAGIDTTNYNVIIQLDRVAGYDSSNGNWTTCKRFFIKPDKLNDGVIRSLEISDIGEVNMGDPKTLSDFITWGMQNYQSKRYAVVVWGSGTPMGICPDMTSSNDPINTMSGELTQAFRQSTEAVHKRIDLFVAWGCNYGTFEHDYVIREYVDVTARSELATWNAEGAATNILNWLNLHPSASAQDFATAWVNAYTDYAITKGRCTGWAALDLNPKYVKLGTDLDIFARELIKAGGRNQRDIDTAIAHTVYCYKLEFDLFHFAKIISNILSLPKSLRDASQNLLNTYGYSKPYKDNPLLNFRFSEGSRASNETWPTGDANELRGCKIYKRTYTDFEGNPPPFGCDTAYVPFKMNNAWKWFLAGDTVLPNEVLLTYDSNNCGDTIISNGSPVLLNVTIRNSGGADATNISATLLTSDPYVNITQPYSTYNNTKSEKTSTNSSTFRILIDTSIVDQRRIWFRLNITANSGSYKNTSTFCLKTAKRPIITHIIEKEALHVSIYPNPAKNFVNVEFDTEKAEKVLIEIFNLNSQVIYSKRINKVNRTIERIDVADYRKGIYFVKVTSNQITKIEKIVKL